MNNIKYLSGTSEEICQNEKELIEKDITEFGKQPAGPNIINFPVYILKNSELKLYQYIDKLHDDCKLSNKVLSKLHICKHIDFYNNVSFTDDGGKNEIKIPKIEFLLKKLEPGKNCAIVIDNDDRSLLAEIMQQLIYIDYPVSEINISLRKEFKDAERTRAFMRKIDILDKTAKDALDKLKGMKLPEDAKNDTSYEITHENAIKAFSEISDLIDKARDVEMKIAVVASKKTGKSVIVNSMLGMELAPTSLEMATPNCCIYRKSDDTYFHLSYGNKKESFNDPESIFASIQQQFKYAQDNQSTHFTIPDMEIAYVTKGNNFDSYTISDTPGPDAAGTGHMVSARKAIKECDVAIFAIDYSKYLTNTEVNYLQEIKKVFEENNKFHTLIFVLNKMDLALSDKGTKSRIKSIDYIRNRLMTIDPQFKDCIIFSTSAQDYYYTCDIRNQAKNYKELEKLLDTKTDWYNEVRIVTDKISENCDEDLESTLSNIDGEVSKIKRQLGYDKVNIECLENYSGMPQMLKHVKYVAQSKAREEIVNNITMTINFNYNAVKAIIDKINNLNILKSKNSDEIEKITIILDNYVNDIKSILTSDIQKEDYEKIKNRNTEFNTTLERFLGNNKNQFPIKQEDLIKALRQDISIPEQMESANELWNDYYRVKQKDRIVELQEKKEAVPRKSISLPNDILLDIIGDYIKKYKKSQIQVHQSILDDAVNNLKQIVMNRELQLYQRTEQCKEELKKNQCGQLLLPELPKFDIEFKRQHLTIEITNPKTFKIDILDNIVYKGIWISICEFFSLDATLEDKVYIRDISEEQIRKIIENYRIVFLDWYSESHIYDILKKARNGLSSEIQILNKNISKTFCEINKKFIEAVDIFKSVLDDRAAFKDNIEKLNKKELFIQTIQQSCEKFMENWKAVENA